MIKNLIYISVLLLANVLCSTVLQGQTYTMGSGSASNGSTISTCSGTFYDPGGTGNYALNQSYNLTFSADNGGQLIMNFSSFDVEFNASCAWDYLRIYDGTNSSGTLFGTYCGTTSPGTITSTTGSLHFVFYSDNVVTAPGWVASISCTAPPGGGGGSPSAKPAEVIFDNATSASTSDGTSLSFSHTVGTGKNRNLIVGLSLENNPTVNYVRYGGQDLTILQSTVGPSFSSKAAIYQLIAPPSGTATVEISLSSAEDIVAGAVSFENVKQDFTWRDLNSSQGTGTIPTEVNNAAGGDMVVDVVAAISPASATPGIQQTERWQNDAGNLLGMGSTEPGAVSTTMSWNLNTSSQWSKSSISLVPADTVLACSNPTTVSYTIQSSSDDAEEEGSDGDNPGDVHNSSSDVELVEDFDSPVYGTMTTGFRFTGVNIPEGAVINHAYLTYRCISPDNPNTNNNVCNLTIKGQDEDNPLTFSNNTNNISIRPTTDNYVTWAPEAWSIGTDYDSPDLSPIVQEIVDRGGWSSGNAMAFIITGSGSRSAYARDGSSTLCARLTVEYCMPGPGGIVNPTVWLKADTATSSQTNGAAVTTWTDVSGNGNNATTTSNTGTGWTTPTTDAPIFRAGSVDDGINFNPSLDFAGGAWLDAAGGFASHHFFIVLKDGISGGAMGYDAEDGNGGGAQSYLQYFASGGTGYFQNGTANNFITILNTTSYGVAVPKIIDLQHVSSTEGSNYVNNERTFTVGGTGTRPNPFTGRFRLGKTSDNQYPFNGKISEVIAYDHNLSETERQKINSYLAIKYGVHLSQATATDYIASDGTVFWDAAANGVYKQRMAGIGRDDMSGLVQKQSRCAITGTAGDLITMGLGSIAADNASNTNSFASNCSFMMWSNNLSANSWTSNEIPEANSQRIAREWRIQETGVVGTVQIRVQDNSASSGGKLPAEPSSSIYLLVDSDNDFSSGAIQVPMTLNGTNWETSYDFADGDYFTFLSKCAADSDNDGICDDVDLDDDNDGITDVDECNSFTTTIAITSNWFGLNGADGTNWDVGDVFYQPGIVNGPEGEVYDLRLEVIDLATDDAAFNGTVSFGGTGNIRLSNGRADFNEHIIYQLSFVQTGTLSDATPEGVLVKHMESATATISDIDKDGNTNLWTDIGGFVTAPQSTTLGADLTLYNYSPSSQLVAGLTDFTIGNFTGFDDVDHHYVGNYGNTPEITLIHGIYGSYTGGTGNRGSGFTMEATFCVDTDNDYIPDYLDLDSDNDGCSDAEEGGGSFTSADIENDTLTGGVDANGIPIIAGSSGQSIGGSQDSTILGCYCPNTDPSTFNPAVSSNNPVCNGAELNLYATGGTEYQWAGPNNFSSPLQNPTLAVAEFIDAGSYMVTISNGFGCSSVQTINVVVDNCNPDVCVENLCNDATVSGLVTATDADGDIITYSIKQQPSNGTLTLSGENYTYDPDNTFVGQDFAIIETCDDEGACVDCYKYFVVTACNQPPVCGLNNAITVCKDIASTGTLNATDPSGGTLTYSIVSQPSSGTISLSGNTYTYTPGSGFEGSVTWVYRATNATGSVDCTVTIYVENCFQECDGASCNPTNLISGGTYPSSGTSIFSINNVNVSVDTDYCLTLELINNCGSCDSTAYVEFMVNSIVLGAVTFQNMPSGTAIIRGFEFNTNEIGNPSQLDIVVNQYNFGTPGTDIVATNATLKSVTELTPQANDDSGIQICSDGGAYTIDVLSNDLYVLSGNVPTIFNAPPASQGTAVVSGDDIIFTPNASYTGTVTFDYQICNGSCCDEGTVTLELVDIDATLKNDSICSGTSALLEVNLTGIDTSLANFSWEISTDNSTWTTIPGASYSSYQTAALTATMYYRSTVTPLVSGCNIIENTATVFVSNLTSSATISPCIDHPLMDVATLSVVVSWISPRISDVIEVSIFGKTERIDVAGGATSPQTIEFVVPADGSVNDTVWVRWEDAIDICPAYSIYSAPTACSNDTIGCSILYLCGEDKPYDGDAWDHGFMNYIDAVNGSNTLDGILTRPDATGFGTYDINSPTTYVNVNFDNYDLIIISATTEAHIASDLVDSLKNFTGAVMNSNYLISDELGISSSTGGYQFQTHLYTDNSTQEEIYNYNNTDSPSYSYVFTRGNPLSGADSYLWTNAGEQALDVNAVYYVYDINDALTGVSTDHGRRVYLGYHMNGIYANAQNGGVLPAPLESYFDPARHLTLIGKSYFDEALIAATLACNDEICDDNIDNDGNGLTDCDDPACETMVVSIGSNSGLCADGTLNLTATGSGGTTPYSWAWTGPVSFSSASQNPSRNNVITAMSGDYILILTDDMGCTATDTTTVLIETAPSITTSGAATICSGGTATLTAAPTGGTGTCIIQWQSSPDGTNAWTNISGANATTYTTPALTTSTFYRATYNCTGTDCSEATSTSQAITVVNDPSVNINGGDVTICTGGNVVLTASVSGGTGTISYQWQSSIDNITFSNISGATAQSYNTGALTQTTYFQVLISFSGNGCESSTSTSATVNVVADPTVSVSGEDQICEGGSITLTATISGGTGTCTLQWQYLNTGVWINLPGETGTTYTTPNLNATTQYRARYTCSGGGCDLATASAHTVTVNPDPTITISVPNNQICEGGGVLLTASPSGGLGTCTLQWQSSPDGSTWTDISGATNTTYTTPALSSNLFYQAVYECNRAGCCD